MNAYKIRFDPKWEPRVFIAETFYEVLALVSNTGHQAYEIIDLGIAVLSVHLRDVRDEEEGEEK